MHVAVSVAVSVSAYIALSFGQPGVLSLSSLGLLAPFCLFCERQ